ncbi:trigger factor [Chloroflexota bacterium]
MKIETQTREDHQISVEVELDETKMDSARRSAARKISQQMKISGFRPGKAPYEVVVRNAGEASITEDAIELLVEEIYPQILEETAIKAGAPGILEEVVTVDPPKFKFVIPLIPTVDLGDYKSIRMKYEWKPPTTDKVEEAIEELRRMYSATEEVDRSIQSGDFVMIDIKGLDGDTILVDKGGHPIFVSPQKKEDEWPFKGFSEKIVGMNVDQEKTISKKFPVKFKDESFAGKNVKFSIVIKTIRGMILPELNDEFAKKVGNFENIQAMKEAIEENLTNQSKAEYDDEFFENLVNKIKSQAEIKYPPQILDREKDHVIQDLNRRLSEQNLEFDMYLKMKDMDYKKFMEEEIIPVAQKRLERSLILEQFAELEKIEVSEEQLNSAFQQTLFQVQRDEEFQKLVKKNKPSQQLMESLARESANRAMLSQTMDRLKALAMGEITDTNEKVLSKKKKILENETKDIPDTSKEELPSTNNKINDQSTD